MNLFVEGFKDSAHLAGEICNIPNGKLIRYFGLGDFLENSISDQDDVPTIAVKALAFFCHEANPHSEIFRFGVLTVGSFLSYNHSKREKQPPQQPLRDLVAILATGGGEMAIRKWITSNFE